MCFHGHVGILPHRVPLATAAQRIVTPSRPYNSLRGNSCLGYDEERVEGSHQAHGGLRERVCKRKSDLSCGIRELVRLGGGG